MNHQLYEDWLLTDEPITPQQSAELKAHLLTCEACADLSASWRSVEFRLRAEPMVAPEPGFTSRWQARLEADHQRLMRRQSLAVMAFYLSGAVVIVASLALLAWPFLRSPDALLVTVFYRLAELFTFADTGTFIVSFLVNLLGGSVPFLGLILFAGLASELAVLWLVSFRLLTNPRRVTTQ